MPITQEMENTHHHFPSRMPAAACITAGEFSQAEPTRNGGFQTPFGVFSDTIFLVGTLTETILRDGKITALRVSDPTGVFTLIASPQNSAVMQEAERLEIPGFVAVTGTVKHRTYAKKTYTELLPDLLLPCDRKMRDAWLCSAAADALARIEKLPPSLERHEFAGMLAKALENVRDAEAAPAAPAVTDVQLLALITELSGKKGAAIADVVARAGALGMKETAAKAALARLMEEGECYTPTTELIKVA